MAVTKADLWADWRVQSSVAAKADCWDCLKAGQRERKREHQWAVRWAARTADYWERRKAE